MIGDSAVKRLDEGINIQGVYRYGGSSYCFMLSASLTINVPERARNFGISLIYRRTSRLHGRKFRIIDAAQSPVVLWEGGSSGLTPRLPPAIWFKPISVCCPTGLSSSCSSSPAF